MINKLSSILISCSASIADSTQPLSNEDIAGDGDVIEKEKEPGNRPFYNK